MLEIDSGNIELYQLIFKVLTGLGVNRSLIENHLKKYSKRDFEFKLSKQVADYLESFNFKDFLKRR